MGFWLLIAGLLYFSALEVRLKLVYVYIQEFPYHYVGFHVVGALRLLLLGLVTALYWH